MGNYQTIFIENCPQTEAEMTLVVEDFSACPQTCLVHASYFYNALFLEMMSVQATG